VILGGVPMDPVHGQRLCWVQDSGGVTISPPVDNSFWCILRSEKWAAAKVRNMLC